MTTWILASLRGRIPAVTGVVAAVVLGVLLTTATMQILVATKPQPPERLTAAPIVLASTPSLDVLGRPSDRPPFGTAASDALVGHLTATPGVTAVIVDRTFLAQVVLPSGAVPADDYAAAGHGWSSLALGPYHLTDGAAPSSGSDVVLGPEFGAAPGDTVRLRTAHEERTVTVSGVLNGPGIYVDDVTATRYAPAPSLLGVEIDATVGDVTSDVRAVASQHDAAVVTDRGALEEGSVEHQRYLSNQFLIALALASLVITIFVVSVTSTFSVASRTREFGLLRAIGVLPGTVRRTVLFEAALLGSAGSMIGVVLGLLVVPGFAQLLRSWGILPAGLAVPVDLAAASIAGLTGVATSVLGAVVAAITASRVSPLAAMRIETARPGRADRLRSVLGASTALGLVAELVLARTVPGLDSVMMAIVMALTAGIMCVCFAPWVIPRLVSALTWIPRRTFTSGPLVVAVGEIRTHRTRTASLAAPVIVAMTLASLTSGFIPTMRVAYPAESAAQLGARAVLVADGAFLTGEQVAEAHERYDVERVSVTTRAHLRSGERSFVVPVTALPSDAGADELTVPRYLADEHGWSVGSRITLVMQDGASLEPAITAIVDEPRGEHPGIALPESIVVGHDPSAIAAAVFLVDPPSGAGSLVAGTEIVSAAAWSAERYDKDLTLLDRYLLVFVALAVGYAVLASVITIAMTMRHRNRQLATLSRLGAVDAQIRRSVVIEAVLVGTSGAVLGMLCSIVPLHEMAAGLAATTGHAVDVHVGWVQAVGAPLLTVLLVGAAAAVASRPTGRRRNTRAA